MKLSEEKRRRILDAALKIFVRHGFYNAKVSEIAREAGVAHGTVYLYFKSKEHLLRAIFEEQMGEALKYIKGEVSRIQGAKAKLKRLIEAQMELVKEHKELTELILIEMRQSSKFLKSEAVTLIVDYIDFIEGILKEGIERGEIRRNLDTTIIATTIYASFEGVVTRWLLEESCFDLERAADEIYSAFMEGVAEG
ncbi:TPA: TetR/AcrR family transcriptional regulator [Candidatus Poribacteria bacterium]|nr:TetR/AcrR family transcriptional regulator [Candidatus Poribacteria bacterium]